MLGQENNKKLSPAKDVAYVAMACAMLIGAQTVFAAVVGVEVVTIILVCFAYVLGVRRGVICAVGFTLLRCFIVGFSPTATVLYFAYYPALAAVFGGLGRIKKSTFEKCPWFFAVLANVLLLGIAVACAAAYMFDLIKISRLWRGTLYVLLWVLFALCVLLSLAFNGLLLAQKFFGKRTGTALRLIVMASVAAVCTVCFTLLDDVITPLILRYSRLSALTYFYASFAAMLPQTVCTVVTVCTLFLPLTAALERAVR